MIFALDTPNRQYYHTLRPNINSCNLRRNPKTQGNQPGMPPRGLNALAHPKGPGQVCGTSERRHPREVGDAISSLRRPEDSTSWPIPMPPLSPVGAIGRSPPCEESRLRHKRKACPRDVGGRGRHLLHPSPVPSRSPVPQAMERRPGATRPKERNGVARSRGPLGSPSASSNETGQTATPGSWIQAANLIPRTPAWGHDSGHSPSCT